MTNEQLEKQISEEFEKYVREYFGLEKDESIEEFSDSNIIEITDMEEAFKAAALPLMKKIEELEKARDYWKFQYDGENADYIKLQKENEELRIQLKETQGRELGFAEVVIKDSSEIRELKEALDFITKESLSPYECATDEQYKDRVGEIRTKFKLENSEACKDLTAKNKEGGV